MLPGEYTKKFTRKIMRGIVLFFIACLLISGCGDNHTDHAAQQNHKAALGPVSGGTVTIKHLDGTAIGSCCTREFDPSVDLTQCGDTKMMTEDGNCRAGSFTIENLDISRLSNNDLILLVVTGGQDIDPNDDGFISTGEGIEGPALNGEIYAIVRLGDLTSGEIIINPLTSMSYAAVQGSCDPEEIKARLDNLAQYIFKDPTSSGYGDLNGDGTMNMLDLYQYDPTDHSCSRSGCSRSDDKHLRSQYFFEQLLPDGDDTKKTFIEYLLSGMGASFIESFMISESGFGDADGDGLANIFEDPATHDTDGDGLSDGSPEEKDMDNDGLTDEDELRYGLNPWIDDAYGDLDDDGLTNSDEIANALDPADDSDGATVDSDSDGIDNGTEISAGTNPKNAGPKFNYLLLVLTIDENASGMVAIAAKDTEGDHIWYSVSVAPQHGTASIDNAGEFTYIPQQNYAGSDTATILIGDDANGGQASAVVNITVNSVKEIPSVVVSISPETIQIGESSTLWWESQNAETCEITPDIGTVDTSGSTLVSPTETTTYTIAATGPGGTATADVTVTVTYPEPTVNLTATPESIFPRESSTLAWTSTDAETCEITPDIGTVDPNGSTLVSPTETTIYTITATGLGGTATANATVTVLYPPTASLTATPDTILTGESSTLAWTSTNADSCEITPDIGTVDPSGSTVVSPTETTTYTITATGPAGSSTDSVTITVTYPESAVSLTATPDSILFGESSTLAWTSTNADSCEIIPDIGTVDPSGSTLVSPTVTTTYTIAATGPGGTATAAVTVTVTPLPTVSLTATPDTILTGESSTLAWTSTNADSCEITPDIGTVDPSGSTVVSPTETTTYTIAATGPAGSSTDSVTITVTYPEPTVSLTATPDSILFGESSTLTWTSTDADTCEISPDIGTVGTNGIIDVSPTETTTYTITATGSGGTVTDSATITVTYPLPTVTLGADPETIVPDESSTLSWTSSNAESCVIEPDVGSVDLSGSIVISPEETTTYTITATGPGGVGTADATITVDTSGLPKVGITQPTDMEEVDADTVEVSGYLNLEGGAVWVNGIEATVSGSVFTVENIPIEPGANQIVASTFVPYTSDPVYYDEITVVRAYTYESQPEGAFGVQYEDLVPSDATVASYDATRFALVSGTVFTSEGSPLAGVTASILDHPEYGTSVSEEDGRFSIPLEGGQTITVVFQKDGLLSSQRKVYVPWNEIAVVEDVQMSSKDTAASTVTFDGTPSSIATHRGEEVTDDFGSRAATVTFTGDNTAHIIDENGNSIGELSEVTVRATTYKAPEAMPAELPPTSAYTYCVDLSVDEAENVSFEKPVMTWVENYLGFDVGTPVPSGYYDRNKGAWVPSENGVVVKLLDTDSDGVVDALDADGDDLPDDLNEDGQFEEEVVGLGDSVQYHPGDTYWRVPVVHFSSWDFNWPVVYASDNSKPNPPASITVDLQSVAGKTCDRSHSSFVEDRSRVFHEDIPIPGTGITLHYASNRVDGYQAKINVPASGDTVSDSLKRIVVNAEIAGRTFEQTLDPLPNQETEIIWDGLDYLGQPVKGSSAAYVTIGFVYDGYYATPASDTDRSFGLSGTNSTGIPAQVESTLWSATTKLPITKGRGSIAEGWTLSPHHELYLADPTPLHKGDGTINKNINILINTIAGNGNEEYSGDGGPAIEAGLDTPWDVEVDSSGNVYIAGPYSIRKIDTDGYITTIAGFSEWSAYLTNNRQATLSGLNDPYSVAVDNTGNVFIADRGHHCIRKVDTNGIITTVAGIGYGYGVGGYGYAGDGGPATEALLYSPTNIALDNAGNMYIADHNNQRIRKVDAAGIITTVAGNGEYGDGGDGGPATEAQFKWPHGLAVDADGNLYISDYQSYRIRKVDPSGIITTVAGTGECGYSGDGGPATEAKICVSTGSIAVDADGNLYIADRGNSCIRKVFTDGTITTVAGVGSGGYSGDGGPATESQLNYARGLAVNPAGHIYIADTSNHCVRKVAPVTAFQNLIGASEIPFAEDNGIGHITYGSGKHKSTIDLATGSTLREFEYDGEDRLTGILDPFGNLITVERDVDGLPSAVISPDGIRTELTIDTNNNLTGIAYPDGSDYIFEYTTDGLMTAEIEPEGNRFEHVFDDIGRLTDLYDDEDGSLHYSRTTYGNGDILTEVLSAEGNLTIYLDHTDFDGVFTSTITDPTGGETLFTQSADGLTTNKSLPCGMELDFEYALDPEYKFEFVKTMTETTPAALSRTTERSKSYEDTNADGVPDQVTDIITVNGKTSTLENDALSGIKTTTSPEGRVVTTAYDTGTLLTQSVSVPELFDTTYGYDSRGRMTSVATNTRQTTYTYDSDGFLESVTDPENHTTTYDYDAVGRVTAVYRPDGGIIGFTYDGNGNMTVLTNAFDIDHLFGYNEVNLKSSYQTPLSGSYSYVYDKDRRLTQTNFPSGKQIVNIYDTTRLSQIQTTEGDIDLTYRCGDKIESINKGTESIIYGYDGKLITSETLSGTLSSLLEYTYDDDFNAASFSYAGDTASYTYDDDGLLTGAGAFTITRNATNGLPESVTGGSLNISRTFNGFGEVSDQDAMVSSQEIGSWSLTRDDNGRIAEKTEAVGGTSSTFVYSYDSVGRLLTVTKDASLVEEYAYDANGARIYEMNTLRDIAGRSYSYSDEDHLLTAGSVTYSYDLDGFLTSKTDASDVTNYSYSSRGELLSVNLPDGTLIEYEHDPLGRRIAKKIDGVVTEKYLWQGQSRLLALYDGSDNLLIRFEYADDRMPVAMTKSSVTYYLSYDPVGSLHVVADSAGNVVKRISYDSFGNIVEDSNPAFEMPFGFAGGLYDPDTGLVRFGYRDYDPDIGRWTAKDPILFDGGDTDLYGYCLNDPVNIVDPLGLVNWKAVAKGAIAIFGGGVAVATGAFASTTGAGAIGGVPAVIGGSAAVGWGVSQMLAGFLDNKIPFMGAKEAVVQGTTEPGLLQDELLGLTTLTDSLLTGRTAPTNIGNINSVIQSGYSIYNSSCKIMHSVTNNTDSTPCKQ